MAMANETVEILMKQSKLICQYEDILYNIYVNYMHSPDFRAGAMLRQIEHLAETNSGLRGRLAMQGVDIKWRG